MNKVNQTEFQDVYDDELPPLPKHPRTRGWTACIKDLERNRNQHFNPDKSSLDDVLTQDDLLVVFEYLDIKTRFKVRRVSKKCNIVFEKSMTLLKTLDFSWLAICSGKQYPSKLDSLMIILKYCTKLRELALSWYYCIYPDRLTTKRILNVYRYCPSILSLKLENFTWYSAHSVRLLGNFHELQVLDLNLSSFPNGEMALSYAFNSLQNLKQLCLRLCDGKISGGCLMELHTDKLEHLDISGCYSITAASIEAFFSREWCVLKRLAVSRLELKMDNFMELLVDKAPKLISLDVSFCDDRMTSNMAKLVELEYFRELRAVGADSSEGVTEYLSALISDDRKPAVEHLERLHLSTRISETLLLVSKLVELKELCLVNSYAYNEEADAPVEVEKAIAAIAAGCANLQRLTLEGLDELSNQCLVLFGRYSSFLSHFGCYNAPHVTNAGLQSLVDGLRTSSRRPEGTKIQMFVCDCPRVDLWRLQFPDLWVSVERNMDCIWSYALGFFEFEH